MVKGKYFQNLKLMACVDPESTHRQSSYSTISQMFSEVEIYSTMQLLIKTKSFWYQCLKTFYMFLSFKYIKYI